MSKNTTQGFVLLYTILIISAVVSASTMMVSMYIKNLKLSGLVQESMVAYNAAEMGGECVLYWFLRGANFDVASANIEALEETATPGVYNTVSAECNGDPLSTDASMAMEILLVPGDTSEPCAVVNVTYGGAGIIHIRSRGYNTCQTSSLRVERGYDIYYR